MVGTILLTVLLQVVVESSNRSSQTAAEWHVYGRGSSISWTDRLCANRSRYSFQVSDEDGTIAVTRWHEGTEPQNAEALPAWIKRTGAQHALDLLDGWLVGKDGGEFGGRLWWIHPDGKKEVLLRSNVVSLRRLSERSALAFTGTLHGWTDVGRVQRVTIENGAARVELLGSLDGLPLAIGEHGDDYLVATSSGVWLVRRTGAPVRLAAVDLGLLIPNSILRATNGAIYVGLNAFVLRLVSSDGGFDAEWMLPPGCAGLTMRDGPCVCTAP
jgi:hypothetical protein